MTQSFRKAAALLMVITVLLTSAPLQVLADEIQQLEETVMEETADIEEEGEVEIIPEQEQAEPVEEAEDEVLQEDTEQVDQAAEIIEAEDFSTEIELESAVESEPEETESFIEDVTDDDTEKTEEIPEDNTAEPRDIRLIVSLGDVRDIVRIYRNGKQISVIYGNPSPGDGSFYIAGATGLEPMAVGEDGLTRLILTGQAGDEFAVETEQPAYARVIYVCSAGGESEGSGGRSIIRFTVTDDTDLIISGDYSAAPDFYNIQSQRRRALKASGWTLPDALYVSLGQAYDTYSSNAVVNGHRGVYFFQPEDLGSGRFVSATCGSTTKSMVSGTHYKVARIAELSARQYLDYGSGCCSQRAQRALAWITHHGQTEYDWNRANGNGFIMGDGKLSVSNQLEAYTITFLAAWCCTNDGRQGAYGTVHVEDGAHALDFMFGSGFSTGLPASTKSAINRMVAWGLAFADAHQDQDENVDEYQSTFVYSDGNGAHQPLLVGAYQGKSVIDEPEVRGDLRLIKTDEKGEPMANVPFLIVALDDKGNEKEQHVMVTDANGVLDTSANRGKRTNGLDGYANHGRFTDQAALDPSVGVWFGSSEPDSEHGALPEGTYKLYELQTEEIRRREMDLLESDVVKITEDGVCVQMPEMVNRRINISSYAGSSGLQLMREGPEISVSDTVIMENLTAGRTYRVVTDFVLRSRPDVILGSAEKFVVPEQEMVRGSTGTTAVLETAIDTAGCSGDAVVAVDRVYEQIHGEEILVAAHDDITNSEQTVWIPAIHTQAADAVSGSHEIQASGNMRIADTVEYSGLKPGMIYKLIGALVDKDTGKHIEVNGEAVISSIEFTAEEESGTADVIFELDGTDLAGKKIVVFETLLYENETVASHEDINDEGQSINVIQISTTTKDALSGTHTATLGRETDIIDTVYYAGLTPGKVYTLEGEVHVQSTGGSLMQSGEAVKARVQFIPQEENSEISLTFTVDTEVLQGQSLVVFERLYSGAKDETDQDEPIAVHEDIEDGGQTVTVPVRPREVVNTGDNGSLQFWACLFVLSFAAFGCLMTRKRKRR